MLTLFCCNNTVDKSQLNQHVWIYVDSVVFSTNQGEVTEEQGSLVDQECCDWFKTRRIISHKVIQVNKLFVVGWLVS